MRSAYRDDFSDPAGTQQLISHLAIAEDQLVIVDGIPAWLDGLRDNRGMTDELLAKLSRDWAQAWERTWQQLEEARALVAAQHRDVTAFDAARAAAGDIWSDVARGRAVDVGNTVEWFWESVSTRPAHEAIAALRSAVPEVVGVVTVPVDVDLSPSKRKVVAAAQVVGGLGVVGLVVYVLLHLFAW